MNDNGLREHLTLNAQQYVEEHHNPEHEKQQYINVVNELIHVNEKYN